MWEEISYPDTGPPPPVPFKMDFCQSLFCFLLGFSLLFGTLPALRPSEETVYAVGHAMKDFFLTASKVGQIIFFDCSRQICQSIDDIARCFGRIVLSFHTELLPPLRSHSYAWLVVGWEHLCCGCNSVWKSYKTRRESRSDGPDETGAQPQPLSPAPPPRLQRQYARRRNKAGNKARRLAESHSNARDILSCFRGISADIKHIKTNVNAFHTKVDTLKTDMTHLGRRLDNTNTSFHGLNDRVGGIYNQFCDIADIVDRRVIAKDSVVVTKLSAVALTPPSPPQPKPLSFNIFHVAQQEPDPPKALSHKLFHIAQQEPCLPAVTKSRHRTVHVEEGIDEITQQSNTPTDVSLIDIVPEELPENAVVAEDQEHEHEMVLEDVLAITAEHSSTPDALMEVVAPEQEEKHEDVPEKGVDIAIENLSENVTPVETSLLEQEEQHEEVALISSESKSTDSAPVRSSTTEKEVEHEIVREEVPAITTESTSEPEAAVDASDSDSLFEGSLPDYDDTVPDPTANTEKPEELEDPVSAAQEEASKKDREALAASERDPDKLGPVMRAFHDWQRQQEAADAQSEVSEEDRTSSEQSVEWANVVFAKPVKPGERVIKPLRSRRPVAKIMEKAVETSSGQEVRGDDVLITPQVVVPSTNNAQSTGRKTIAARSRRTSKMGNKPAGITTIQGSNLLGHLNPIARAAPVAAPTPTVVVNQIDETTAMEEIESTREYINKPLALDNHVPPAPPVSNVQADEPMVAMKDEHAKAAFNQPWNVDHQVFPSSAAFSNHVHGSTVMKENEPVGFTNSQLQNVDNHIPPAPAALHHHDIDWAAQLDRFESLEPSSNQALTSDDLVSSTPAAIDDQTDELLSNLQNDPEFNSANQPLNLEANPVPAPAEVHSAVNEYDPYHPAIVTERTDNDSNAAPPPLPAVNDPTSACYDPTAFNYQVFQHQQQQRQLEEQQQSFASSWGSRGCIPGLTMLQEEEEERQQQWQWQAQLLPQPQDVVPEQGLEQQGLSQQDWEAFDQAHGTTNFDMSTIDMANIDPRLFENEGSGPMMMMMMDENDYSLGAGGVVDVMGGVEQIDAKNAYDVLE